MRFRYALPALLAIASLVAVVPADDRPSKSGLPIAIPKSDAGEITIDGSDAALWLAEVNVHNVPAGSAVVWDVVPEANAQIRVVKVEKCVVFAGPAGEYTVKCRVVKGEDIVADLRKTVTLTGGVKPGPNPDPNPKPQPDPPEPVGSVSTFVVVEDTLKAGPWRGEILGSPKVEAWYRQLQGTRNGPIHLLVDSTTPVNANTKKWADAAAGKKLPYLFMLDAAGKVVKELPAPIASPDAFVSAFDLVKEKRAMGLILADGKPKLKWTEFGTTPSTPIIPRDQWKPMKLLAFLPGVYDQDGRGQCASSACCTTMEAAARAQGIVYPKLSAGDLYSRVNGGRDQGSMLEDNLAEAINNGVATAASVPYVWNGRRATDAATVAQRKKYRIAEAYWCPNFDAMASAIQQGFIVEHGLMWGSNFTPDKDGWLPARINRSQGGHALCGFGLAQRGTAWGIVTRNSWSASWGAGGNCVIPESLFGSNIGGFFAIRVVTDPAAVSLRLDPFRREAREFALAW